MSAINVLKSKTFWFGLIVAVVSYALDALEVEAATKQCVLYGLGIVGAGVGAAVKLTEGTPKP